VAAKTCETHEQQLEFQTSSEFPRIGTDQYIGFFNELRSSRLQFQYLLSALLAIEAMVELRSTNSERRMKSNQARAWVASLFLAAIMLAATEGLAKTVTAVKTYVQPICKFSIDIPTGARTILPLSDEETEGGKNDCVSIRWKGGALGVRLMKMSMEKAIDESGALMKDEHGKWYRPGRFDTQGPTQTIQFGNLKGLYGTATCGVSDSAGFHAAAGSCLSGFLTDGDQTAYFETDGIFPIDTVVKVVMPSFKFGKP
jgi:hypothetical protein